MRTLIRWFGRLQAAMQQVISNPIQAVGVVMIGTLVAATGAFLYRAGQYFVLSLSSATTTREMQSIGQMALSSIVRTMGTFTTVQIVIIEVYISLILVYFVCGIIGLIIRQIRHWFDDEPPVSNTPCARDLTGQDNTEAESGSSSSEAERPTREVIEFPRRRAR